MVTPNNYEWNDTKRLVGANVIYYKLSFTLICICSHAPINNCSLL